MRENAYKQSKYVYKYVYKLCNMVYMHLFTILHRTQYYNITNTAYILLPIVQYCKILKIYGIAKHIYSFYIRTKSFMRFLNFLLVFYGFFSIQDWSVDVISAYSRICTILHNNLCVHICLIVYVYILLGTTYLKYIYIYSLDYKVHNKISSIDKLIHRIQN